MVHGFSQEIVEQAWAKGFNNTQMMDLAGNAFVGAIPMAITIAILCNFTDKQLESVAFKAKPKKKKKMRGKKKKKIGASSEPCRGRAPVHS